MVNYCAVTSAKTNTWPETIREIDVALNGYPPLSAFTSQSRLNKISAQRIATSRLMTQRKAERIGVIAHINARSVKNQWLSPVDVQVSVVMSLTRRAALSQATALRAH